MNIEAFTIKYLMEKLKTSRVYAEAPESLDGEYWIIDKTGSSEENQITTTTLALQSCADDKLTASEMNDQGIAAMKAFTDRRGISAVKLITDYNFTNTAKKKYRYQAVFEITHHYI